MTQPSEDSRNRPVVLQTRAEPAPRHLRKPARMLAGATLVVAALSGAAGLAFGGSAVWSVVGPQGSNNAHDPIWVAPPSQVTQVPVPARVDDQRTTTDPRHPTPTTTTTSGRGRGGGEAEPNDPDRPATAGKKAAATHTEATHEEATHDAAPATTPDEERRKGAGGSGGGGGSTGGGSSTSGGGGGSSSGGGGGGGGSDDTAHGGGGG